MGTLKNVLKKALQQKKSLEKSLKDNASNAEDLSVEQQELLAGGGCPANEKGNSCPPNIKM